MKLTNEHKLYIEFSIGCGLQVLPIYESKYKDDKRPRNALEAAQAFLVKPSLATKKAAAYAADAADAAAYAAADAAAYAADAAAQSGERSWQVKFLAYLNFKYGLAIKIRGVE